MKSENFYAIHHTFSQSVVDALKKIVAEGYQLRTTYLLTQGKLSNLEFKNLKKPYNKADWKWISIHADKTALYFDNNSRDKGILLTMIKQEQYPDPSTPIKYGFIDFLEPEYFKKSKAEEYLENQAFEQLSMQSDHIIRIPTALGKVSEITIYGIVHQGKVKAIIDPWDVEDDEILEYNIDFNLDAFITIKCPDENLKLLLFGHLFLSHANEPIELEIDPYHLPYVIKQEIKSSQ